MQGADQAIFELFPLKGYQTGLKTDPNGLQLASKAETGLLLSNRLNFYLFHGSFFN